MLRDGSGRQHTVSIGFLSDPRGTRHVIQESLRPSVATATRMGLGARATLWFGSRLENLITKCNDEVIILSVSTRSDEHTSELQSLMRISYAVFCLKKKIKRLQNNTQHARNQQKK